MTNDIAGYTQQIMESHNPALSYVSHELHTTRSLAMADASYGADFHAKGLGLLVQTSYGLLGGATGITPYATIQWQQFNTPNYHERSDAGAGPDLSLSYAARMNSSVRTELGASYDRRFELDGGAMLGLSTALAWVRDRGKASGVRAAFRRLQSSNFEIDAATSPADLALLSAALELRLVPYLAIDFKLRREFGHRRQARAGTATLRYGW
jgi:outer membrane autotransporter protein